MTRLKIWVKSRTRKDGTPINTNAAENIVSEKHKFWFAISNAFHVNRLLSDVQKKAAELGSGANPSSAKNQDEDTLVKQLGPDNPGCMRVMGRNMSKNKLACFQVKHKTISQMQEKQYELYETVNQLKAELAAVKNQVIQYFCLYIEIVGDNKIIRIVLVLLTKKRI